jgi:hypothetical protein
MSVCETGRSANHSSYHLVPPCGVKAIARPDVRLRAAQQCSILMMDWLGCKTGEATGHRRSAKCGVDLINETWRDPMSAFLFGPGGETAWAGHQAGG